MSPRGDPLLTSVQLTVVLGIAQLLVVWGLLKEPDLLRSIAAVTFATLLVVHAADGGRPAAGGWVHIRGAYFLLLLVLLAFGAAVYAAAERPINQHYYVWDVAALFTELILTNAAVTYARRTP